MKVTVSVIMSILNGEYTMNRAIDSILNQTYREIELIICDDGSSDATWQRLQEYRQRDARIALLSNENTMGLAASLNRCLRLAKGEYIARQDADDYSDPERIEKTLAYLRRRALPFAACGVRISGETGIWSRRMYPEEITRHEIIKHNPFFHPTMVFKKSALEAVGGYRVAPETRRTEDYDLVMRLAAEQMIGQNLQEYLYEVSEPQSEYKKKHRRITRWYEFRTRLFGYKKMKVPIGEYVYAFKPLLLCCIPLSMLSFLKRIQWHFRVERTPS